MTTQHATNGHTASEEEFYQSGTNGDRSADRAERRLLEAFDELWNGFVDPRDDLWDADGRWQLLGGDLDQGRASRSAFTTEQEHRDIRRECRHLALTNEFAINGHENRISYIVGSGHVYRATVRKRCEASAGLVSQVQDLIDEFVEVNQWHARQQELVRRRDRDGEAFLRFFFLPDGSTRVRFVEPGQVAAPPGMSREEASFGILTEPEDVETVRAYFIDGRPVPAGELQHRKANVDINVKRGLPLFFPVRKNLLRAEKLLRNMSVVAEIQSAIAIIRRHRGASRTAVQQMVGDQADTSVSQAGSGKSSHFRRYAPGTILDAPGGVEYDFPAAALDAGSYVTVLQAELRAIASRLVMPEFMLTSDASNANYSSTMVAEGPAIRIFQRLQAEQMADDLAVLWKAVGHAVRAGRLGSEALECLEIQASPPSLAVRDALQEAQVFRIEHAAGILSPQTWSLRRGLDYDQEQANLAAHRLALAAIATAGERS